MIPIKTFHFLLILFLLQVISSKRSLSQTFDVYLSNDSVVNSTTYEFDVMIRSTTSATWSFRTIQFGFYVNPQWLPAGNSPTISYINGSTSLNFYTPNSIQMNASPNSLSAFQIATNLAGACSSGTVFSSQGQTEKVGRFSIVSNSGPMNCVPSDISMIRPFSDVAPGGNVVLKMAVTEWTDPTCAIGTSAVISLNGSYTSISAGTLLEELKNMSPSVISPTSVTIPDCSSGLMQVVAAGLNGQSSALNYQWYENGIPLSDNSIYNGTSTDQLGFSNPGIGLDGNNYHVTVDQCNVATSDSATLTVTSCTEVSEFAGNNFITVFPNPSDGEVTIILKEKNNFNRIDVINSLSQLVYSDKLNTYHYSGPKEIHLTLAEGIYFVKLLTQEGLVVKKIIVN